MATQTYALQPTRLVSLVGGWRPRRYHYLSGVPGGTYGFTVTGDLITNVTAAQVTDAEVEAPGGTISGAPYKRIVYGFADPAVWDAAVPVVASTPVKSVQVTIEMSTSAAAITGTTVEVGLGRLGNVHAQAVPASPASSQDTASQSRQAYTLTAWSTAPDGAPWTIGDLRDLRVGFVAGNDAASQYRLYQVTVTVTVRPPPEVTVTILDETGLATSAPTDRQPAFTAAYTQADGYPAERFQARLLSGTAPDPDVDVPVWDSGPILASTAHGQAYADRIGYPLSPLASGSYFLFVRASDQRGRWGPWGSSGAFATAGSSLTAPTVIAVAAGAAPGSVDVTVTGTLSSWVVIERSVDAGATWDPARVTETIGAAPTAEPLQMGATTVTFHDLDAPTGSLLYRTRAVTYTGGGYVNGAFVTSLGEGPTSTSTWRTAGVAYDNTVTIAVLADPDTGTWVRARRRWGDLHSTSEERQVALRAVGAVYPVVVADSAVGAETFEVEVRLDAASWATFEAIRQAQRPVRWLPELGPAMWVRLGPTRTETLVRAAAAFTTPTRWVTIGATQVDGP